MLLMLARLFAESVKRLGRSASSAVGSVNSTAHPESKSISPQTQPLLVTPWNLALDLCNVGSELELCTASGSKRVYSI